MKFSSFVSLGLRLIGQRPFGALTDESFIHRGCADPFGVRVSFKICLEAESGLELEGMVCFAFGAARESVADAKRCRTLIGLNA